LGTGIFGKMAVKGLINSLNLLWFIASLSCWHLVYQIVVEADSLNTVKSPSPLSSSRQHQSNDDCLQIIITQPKS